MGKLEETLTRVDTELAKTETVTLGLKDALHKIVEDLFRPEQEELEAGKAKWSPVLEPWLEKLTAQGNALLKPPFTLVAVTAGNDTFVTEYYPPYDDPVKKALRATLSRKIEPPLRIFLFDWKNQPALQLMVDERGKLVGLWLQGGAVKF